MKIGIVGVGFVGNATNTVLSEHFETVPYDKFKEPYTENKGKLRECEVIFVAVPSPMKENGENDLSYIYDALDMLKSLGFDKKPLIVIRSTIVPGSTKSLAEKYPGFNFAFNPEFLRERFAVEDFKNANRVVFGVDSDESFETLREIYSSFAPSAKYFKTDFNTAEMIKYAANTMLASQIIAANEIYNLSKVAEADYGKILEVLDLDERIGKNLQVPGPDGDFGFGGKCFPKDLNAIISFGKSKGYEPAFFEQVWKSNLEFRKNKDWLDIPGAVSENRDFK